MTEHADADVEFFWDPICPWAWLTSRWVVAVARQRGLDVNRRFICLRLLNSGKDYERDFPAGCAGVHTTGQKLLRVAAAVREADDSFFGPVISRVPRGDEALRLWDAVWEVATFPGLAELKRSRRERPQLADSLG